MRTTDAVMGVHQNALSLRAYRQQLLASNIANADTPNYKAVDIDFRAELQRAKGSSAGQLSLNATSPSHLKSDAGRANPLATQTRFRTPSQASIDGNTVEMDVERAQFAENAIHYEASLAFINARIRTMLAAMQG